MNAPKIVSRDEWLAARRAHLAKEKELTRQRDLVAAAGRALPWLPVEKSYAFDGPNGRETLAELFGGKSQLVIYHFMFGPDWKEGCVGCSFLADHLDGPLLHLGQRDVSLVVVSRAPFAQLEAFRKRMDWRFKWVSSFGSDFNFDYQVSFTAEEIAAGNAQYNYDRPPAMGEEAPGTSVFYKDGSGRVFHTYSTFGRGDESLIGAYAVLDLVPKGRDENVRGNLTDWVKHHDRYDAGGTVDATGRYVAP
jgi:predicted dithiol-disulfide oxidoreductase (DUF899 family)